MGALLNRLASLSGTLSRIETPPMPFRMADYAAFGWRVFRATGKETDWLSLLTRLEGVQAEFAGEGDGLIEVLRILLDGSNGKIGRLDSGELFKECNDASAAHGFPLPRTPSRFGQKLTNMRRVIELELHAKFSEGRGHQGRRNYHDRGSMMSTFLKALLGSEFQSFPETSSPPSPSSPKSPTNWRRGRRG